MAALALVSALSAPQTPRPSARLMTASDTEMSLTLSTDRPTYYVGEPVFLNMTFRNTGPRPLVGFFVPVRRMTEVRYRKGDEPFAALLPVRREHDPTEWAYIMQSPRTLNPGEERKSVLLVVSDGTRHRFVLNEPGRYELKVATRPAPAQADHVVTATVSFDVEPVPSRDRAAFAVYARLQLARVVQAPGHVVETDRRMVKDAVAFVRQYPLSHYAHPVREALRTALKSRVARGKETEDDLAFLAELGTDEPRP